MKLAKEDYMRRAIMAAKAAQDNGGVAIGAVLVNQESGEVIATGGSLALPANDPTAHAEVNCIREASKKLGTPDLYNHTLYSTLEPCQMCLSAAAWAKIPRVYFGAYRKDVDANLFDVRGDLSDEKQASKMNLRENIKMEAQGGILEDECADLLGDYHAKSKHS